MKHVILTHTVSQGYIPAYTDKNGSPIIYADEAEAVTKITNAMFEYNTARMNENEFQDLITEPEDFAVPLEEAQKEYNIKI